MCIHIVNYVVYIVRSATVNTMCLCYCLLYFMIQYPTIISHDHALLIVYALHGYHSGVQGGDSHCLVMDVEENLHLDGWCYVY